MKTDLKALRALCDAVTTDPATIRALVDEIESLRGALEGAREEIKRLMLMDSDEETGEILTKINQELGGGDDVKVFNIGGQENDVYVYRASDGEWIKA